MEDDLITLGQRYIYIYYSCSSRPILYYFERVEREKNLWWHSSNLRKKIEENFVVVVVNLRIPNLEQLLLFRINI